MNENKLKHLEFIQSTIARMNSYSFLIKGWAITITSALFAFAAKETDIHYVFIAYIGIPIFWGLDVYYLSQEKKFRDLYNSIRQKEEVQIDFSMKTTITNENSWLRAIFNKTIWPIYMTTMVITVCIILFFTHTR